jgi:hypothetical protein
VPSAAAQTVRGSGSYGARPGAGATPFFLRGTGRSAHKAGRSAMARGRIPPPRWNLDLAPEEEILGSSGSTGHPGLLRTTWSRLGINGVFGLRNELVHRLLTPHYFCLVCGIE